MARFDVNHITADGLEVTPQLQDAIIDDIRDACSLGQYFGECDDAIAYPFEQQAESRFCRRVEAAIALATRMQEMFCGTSTSPFCQRLAQGIDVAKKFREAFCTEDAATREIAKAAGKSC